MIAQAVHIAESSTSPSAQSPDVLLRSCVVQRPVRVGHVASTPTVLPMKPKGFPKKHVNTLSLET
jgi:hypothetical protein